jgi:DNA-binding NtrC family response regulator
MITSKGMNALKSVDWTGNIRELRNIIERLVILCGNEINQQDISLYANPKQF